MEQQNSQPRNSSKTLYINVKAFLESFGLKHFEAQIILEVCNYKEYYIDVETLRKKMPKTLGKFISNLEEILKELIQRGFLYQYESKKEKFCVRSSPFGRDFATEAARHGFSDSIESMPILEEKYSKVELLCYDPQQFQKGEIRFARGPDENRIKVHIIDIVSSGKVFGTTEDGRTIYGRKLIGTVQCPRCSNQISIDFSYTPENCYSHYNDFQCNKCGFKFKLGCSLMYYYT